MLYLFYDLKQAHVLNQLKESPFPRKVRELITLKYVNVLDHVLSEKRTI